MPHLRRLTRAAALLLATLGLAPGLALAGFSPAAASPHEQVFTVDPSTHEPGWWAAVTATPTQIALPSDLLFDSGATQLDTRAADAIAEAADAIARTTGTVVIAGHTDTDGNPADNVELSRARADAVRDALVVDGVPLERLTIEAHGDTQPVAGNSTETGKARNRRVEIHLPPGP